MKEKDLKKLDPENLKKLDEEDLKEVTGGIVELSRCEPDPDGPFLSQDSRVPPRVGEAIPSRPLVKAGPPV